MLHELFEFCGDSIAGRDKVGDADFYLGGSNQDHLSSYVSEELCILIVTDGCTGSDAKKRFRSSNQLGSINGAHYVIESILDRLPIASALEEQSFWEDVHAGILERLCIHAELLAGNRSTTWSDDYWNAFLQAHFMFTIVGVCLTPETGRFFSIGDGYVSHNDQLMRLGSTLSGPAYIGRCLMKPDAPYPTVDGVFRMSDPFQVADTQNLGVFTDGLTHLLNRCDRYIPGTEELLAPISRLWSTDAFFEESAELTCWLRSLGNEFRHTQPIQGRPRVEQGLIRDDFAFMAARRKDKPSCTTELPLEESN